MHNGFIGACRNYQNEKSPKFDFAPPEKFHMMSLMKKNVVRTFFPLVNFYDKGLFRFLGFREGYHGICGCFCPPITCTPPEIIARLSLKGLQGVLDDFGRKKKPGVAFWGDFGENFIFAIKRHFNHVHLVRTTRNDCQVVPEGSQGSSRQFWWKKKNRG